MKIKLCVILFVFSLSIKVYSQVIYPMSDSIIYTCSGYFTDNGLDGQQSTFNYSANENFTYTICPSTGNNITIKFNLFDLGMGDSLFVYDGATSLAPLIGIYDSRTISPGNLANTNTNTTGCLTFVFTSDSSNEDKGWLAEISCELLCQDFNLVPTFFSPDTVEKEYINLCIHDTISDSIKINVQGQYPYNNLRYTQSDNTTDIKFYVIEGLSRDTIDIVNSSVFSYSFNSPGAYFVDAVGVDTNNCQTITPFTTIVRVSSPPSFDGTYSSDTLICAGDTSFFKGNVKSYEWTNKPKIFSGDSVFIPDAVNGKPSVFTSDLIISGFQLNSVINTFSDIGFVRINMEHSWISDFTIDLICPIGLSAQLKTNAGGGKFLGQACDNTTLTQTGFGWNYYWVDPTVGNGTMSVNALAGRNTVSTVELCNLVPGPAITAMDSSASYSSNQQFQNFVGCPINGTWTLRIVDNLGEDDGTIFNWEIFFTDSTTYPDRTVSFSPGIDTSYFVPDTNNQINTGNPYPHSIYYNKDSISISPDFKDSNIVYTYRIIDNFGCSYEKDVEVKTRALCDVFCCNTGYPDLISRSASCYNSSDGFIKITPTDLNVPPYSYYWYDSKGNLIREVQNAFTPDSVSNLKPDLYLIKIVDGNCCKSERSYRLGYKPPILSTLFNIIPPSCVNFCDATATVNSIFGTPPYTYFWSNGEITSTAYRLCEGDNYVKVQDNKGCGDTLKFFINYKPPIIATGFKDTICTGNSTWIKPKVSGGSTPYIFSWSIGKSTDSILITPTVKTTYVVTVNDFYNCTSDTAVFDIYVKRPITGILNSSFVCPGEDAKVEVSVKGGDGNYNYKWDNGDTTKENIFPISNSIWSNVTVTDLCGTTPFVDSIYVKYGSDYKINATIEANPSILCKGQNSNLNAVAINGINGYNYKWSNGENKEITIVTPDTNTTYTVTITDNCLSVPDTVSVLITIQDSIIFDFDVENKIGCLPFEAKFNVVNDSTYSYQWDFGNGWMLYDKDEEVKFKFNTIGCNDVKIKITDTNLCVSEKTFPCFIKVIPNPVAGFDYSPHFPTIIDPSVVFFNTSINSDSTSYNISFGEEKLFFTKNQNFTYTFPYSGTYLVRQIIKNESNCIDSIIKYVTVKDETTIQIPSAFSPNGDGINDYFSPIGERFDVDDYNLKIYNRWGKMVFESNNANEYWNGDIQGVSNLNLTSDKQGESISSVYVYILKYKESSGHKKIEKGYVFVIK